MSLYRRNSVWWVRFTTPTGGRIRRSTGTTNKEQAQEYHDRLKAEIWKTQQLGRKPRRTWEQAAVRWLKEKAHKASLDADSESVHVCVLWMCVCGCLVDVCMCVFGGCMYVE